MKFALLLALLAAMAVATVGITGAKNGGRSAAAVSAMPPDLRALPVDTILMSWSGSTRFIRISTTTWNAGAGPLHLVADAVDQATQRRRVYQRVYNGDGSYQQYEAGWFVWHPSHNHFHFDDYATYILKPVVATGERIANKTTFCIVDTDRVELTLPGAPQSPQYTSCGAQTQGMSVGWGDTYTWDLPGQEIDVTGLPDGDYYLTLKVDPKDRVVESDDSNNTSTIVIRLTANSVSIVPATPTPTRTVTPTPTDTRTPTPTGTSTSTPTPTITSTPTITPTATPTFAGDPTVDTDGDGCTDLQEYGSNPRLGGGRDSANRWDFYDVNGTRHVDAVDIALVRSKFNGPGPIPPADEMYDRSVGAALWAPGPPDGKIDAVDIGLVRAEFGHSCR